MTFCFDTFAPTPLRWRRGTRYCSNTSFSNTFEMDLGLLPLAAAAGRRRLPPM